MADAEESNEQRWRKAYNWLGKRAEKISTDAGKLRELVDQSIEKMTRHRSDVSPLMEQFKALIRMLHARLKGRYPHTPVKTIVAATVALLYFVSPFDFIPDFIPILGLTYDLGILAFLFKMIQDDLNAFRQWEREQGGAAAEDLPMLE